VRRAAKIDANQQAIVDALRKCGATVQSLAAVGNGVPDLLVGYRGYTALIEVKDGKKARSARMLTEDQQRWHATWNGGALAVVGDVEAALRVLKVMGQP
jgi:hypothetical protein